MNTKKNNCQFIATPKLTIEQDYKCNMLVSAVVQFTSEDCDANVEDEILKNVIGHFDHYSAIEHVL